jgi:N-acetylmuramoyl-L-alanine amidase
MLVAVDSGHGMETAGKSTPPIPEAWFGKKKGEVIREKEFNKPAAEYLIKALERNGFQTINVSPGTTDVSLTDRYTRANNAKADIFVAKHYNASIGVWNNANGIETIVSQYASNNSRRLASLVQTELVKAYNRNNRGVKTDIEQSGINVAVLRYTNMPAILTESGFMDNLAEAKTMLDPIYQKLDAEATCKGICNYFGVTYVEELPTGTISKTSSKEDIRWMQTKLNTVMVNESFNPLAVDGIYSNKTRLSVLIYWEKLGWNSGASDSGWTIGTATINALAAGRTK